MKIENIDEIYTKIRNTLITKNHDYGDSFHYLYKEWGMESVLIRLNDKLQRLKTLTKEDRYVKDESVKDTLTDIVGYALLGLDEIESENTQKGNKLKIEKQMKIEQRNCYIVVNYCCPECGFYPKLNNERKYKNKYMINFLESEWDSIYCSNCGKHFYHLIV